MPDQIKAQSQSILKTNRTMVYSLSPGSGVSPTMDKAKEIMHVVNMYRVTGDDWDSWAALKGHFDVAASAAKYAGQLGLGKSRSGLSWPGKRSVLSLVAWIQTHSRTLMLSCPLIVRRS